MDANPFGELGDLVNGASGPHFSPQYFLIIRRLNLPVPSGPPRIGDLDFSALFLLLLPFSPEIVVNDGSETTVPRRSLLSSLNDFPRRKSGFASILLAQIRGPLSLSKTPRTSWLA